MRYPLMTTLMVSAMAIATAAHAQSSTSGTPGTPPAQEQPTQAAPTEGGGQAAVSLEELMSKEVYTTGGEQVGEVSDVLVDTQGQPQKVVIEHGGFLGIGQREVAMDIGDIQMQGDQVQISATRDELQQMPEWDDSQVASSGFTSQRGSGDTGTGTQTGATPNPTGGATPSATPESSPAARGSSTAPAGTD